MTELFGPTYCILISKISRTQNLLHSLDFNALYLIQSTFLRFSKFPQIKEIVPSFLGGTNSADRPNYIVPFLYFNFKNLKDPNSFSCIRFQCIVLDSSALFSDFQNFLKLKRGDLISCGEPILQNG